MALTPIQPQASPVESFVRPQAPALPVGPSRLDELSHALSFFTPALTQTLDHHVDRVTQKEIDSATAKRTETALNYKEAVSKGIIQAHQNPFFIQAWQEQDGKVAADKYNADLQTALVVGDFASSVDPNQTEPLLNTFRTNWMKQQGIDSGNKDFMNGFAKHASAYEAAVRDHQGEAVGQRIQARAQEGLFQSAQGEFDAALQKNLPASETADGLKIVMDRMILGGMPPQQANRIILDAAVAKSIETGSMHPFDVLDTLKTGSGYLGRTADATQAREVMQNRINDHIAATDAHAHSQKVWDDQETDQSVTADIFAQVFQNSLNGKVTTLQDMAPDILALAKVNPARAETMKQLVLDSAKPKTTYDSPSVSSQLTVDLYEGRLTNGQIVAAHVIGSLTLETTSKLLDKLHDFTRQSSSDAQAAADRAHAQRREQISDERYNLSQQRLEEKDPVASTVLKEGASALHAQFGSDVMGLNKLSTDTIDRMNSALAAYYTMADQWMKANPNAKTEDRIKKFNELRKTTMESYPPAQLEDIGSNKPAVSHEPLKVTPQGPVGTLTNLQEPTVNTQRLVGSPKEWQDEYDKFLAKDPSSKITTAIKGMTPAQAKAYIAFQQALNPSQ